MQGMRLEAMKTHQSLHHRHQSRLEASGDLTWKPYLSATLRWVDMQEEMARQSAPSRLVSEPTSANKRRAGGGVGLQ